MTLDAARKIDEGDEARVEISLIKFYAARVLHDVIDRAVQVHGARGLTDETPLAAMLAHGARRAHLRRPRRGAPHGRRPADPAVVRGRRALALLPLVGARPASARADSGRATIPAGGRFAAAAPLSSRQSSDGEVGATGAAVERQSVGVRRVAGVAAAALVLPAAAVAAGSADVAALQVALRAKGAYVGTIDGVPGTRTTRAVARFQHRAGLVPDGVAGPRTRRALGKLGGPALGSRTLHLGAVGADVAALQFALAWHGSSVRAFRRPLRAAAARGAGTVPEGDRPRS